MGYGREVKTLEVVLNFACQAKCAFCFNPPLTPEFVEWKLPLERLAGELLAHHEKGYRGVTYSGGEVTLLPELPKILRLTRKAGYSAIAIITNGVKLAEADYTRELVDSGLALCALSVHGSTPERHDRMVRLPGAFDKVLSALAHLERMNIPVALKYVLTRENLGDVEAFVERFAANPSISELHVYFPHYDGMMAVNAEALKIKMSDAAAPLRRTLALGRRLGVEKKLRFGNIIPCAMPDLLERLCNWDVCRDDVLIDPKGIASGAFDSQGKGRVKTDECRACAFDEDCLGFERSYVELYGVGELKAVKSP